MSGLVLPLVGGAICAALVWRLRTLTRAEKALATLVPPGGLGAAALLYAAAVIGDPESPVAALAATAAPLAALATVASIGFVALRLQRRRR